MRIRGGNIYEDPKLLLPGYADATNLQPFYDIISRVIRTNAPQQLVFFEKSLIDLSLAGTGLSHAPGGAQFTNQSVYSYHIYCGKPDGSVLECDGETTLEFEVAMNDAKKLGTISFLTEFGASSNDTKQMSEINLLMNEAEQRLQSFSYWQFKFFEDLTSQNSLESLYDTNGQLELNKVSTLSRTYFRAVTGTLLFSYFDPYGGRYTATFSLNTGIFTSSEIYLNEDIHYPNGFSVSIYPPESVSWRKAAKNILLLTATNSAQNGQSIYVTITTN